MEYELRKLGAKDIFPLSKIISAIGVKEFRACFESDEIKRAAAQGVENVDASAIGVGIFIEMAGIILANLPKCEKDLFAFLDSICTNMTRKQIEEMDLASFAQLIVDVIQKEEFRDFMRVVLKSFR